ncbi:hypothetical protein GC163_21920 [bacterium]|nr:hypothetical protein [bacterium]
MKSCRFCVLGFAVFGIAFSGCGGGVKTPELAMVTGKVTINGEIPPSPLEVVYEPQNQGDASVAGSSSMAVTDIEGKYELKYMGQKPGAVLGEHTVRIHALAGNGEDVGPAGGADAVAIDLKIPPQYDSASTLKQQVTAGNNDHTIELTLKMKK